ncbi:MAG: hypothetical protein AAFQ88_06220 [Pseudomonadota bacterium]
MSTRHRARHGRPERLLTCCFCGARSILPAGRTERARLVCHGCGAPISAIEVLEPSGKRKKSKKGAPVPHPAERRGHHLDKDRSVRRKKGKRRKMGWDDRLERFWDKLEDAVEDIFD